MLPIPQQYSSWQEWANYLIGALRQAEEQVIPQMQIFTVAELANVTPSEGFGPVFVSNETGGAVMAFADGAAWRRCTDRAVVS